MPVRKFNVWFKIETMDARWLPKSPVDRAARCDRVNSHIVQRGEPRLQLGSGDGLNRKRGKGQRSEWLCVACALGSYSEAPPSQVYENQERMKFD